MSNHPSVGSFDLSYIGLLIVVVVANRHTKVEDNEYCVGCEAERVCVINNWMCANERHPHGEGKWMKLTDLTESVVSDHCDARVESNAMQSQQA